MKQTWLNCFVVLLILLSGSSLNIILAQSPGLIVRPAAGNGIGFLNPHGDSYTSASTASRIFKKMDSGWFPSGVITINNLDGLGPGFYIPRLYRDGKLIRQEKLIKRP